MENPTQRHCYDSWIEPIPSSSFEYIIWLRVEPLEYDLRKPSLDLLLLSMSFLIEVKQVYFEILKWISGGKISTADFKAESNLNKECWVLTIKDNKISI